MALLEYKCLGWSLSLVMEMEGEESLCDILILILDLDSCFNAFFGPCDEILLHLYCLNLLFLLAS